MNEVHVQKGGGLTDGERVPVAFQSSVPFVPSLFRYLRHLRVLPINSFLKKNYCWLLWVFVATCRLSLVAARGGYSLVGWGMWASQCGGFSCCRAQALEHAGLVVEVHGLSNCGSQA